MHLKLINPLFQFLYGAIGGSALPPKRPKYSKFQFLYGAIGGLISSHQHLRHLAFQFLYGAIGGTEKIFWLLIFFYVSIPIWCDWW